MRLTLNGFYNYDNTLFDGVVLPEGVDKPTLINEIMKRGDLYTYHQSLEALKMNITYWFSRRSYDFQMMFDALRAEYSPIENYDRKESISRTSTKNGADTTTGENTATSNSNLGRTESLTSVDGVSAFNASDFSDAAKRDSSTESHDNTYSNANGTNVTTTEYGSGEKQTEENRIHGNIGVTTAQQMINEEINMRMRFDLYRVIADQFEREFLIQVY